MSETHTVTPRNRPDDCQRWELPAIGGHSVGGGVTVEDVEAIQKQAYDEGFAQGRRDGLAAGQKQVRSLEQALRALAEPLQEFDRQAEQEMLTLVKVVAGQLVRRELKSDPGQIIAVVREAIGALPASSREIQVHLHPEDAALVREVLAPEQGERPWRIIDDPVLTRGDCRVLTEASRVDATLETRLNTIITSILGGERDDDERDDD